MKTKIAYCIPGLYYPSGMERALTLKANYLAAQKGKYEVYIIITEGRDKPPYYTLAPEVRLAQLGTYETLEVNYAIPEAVNRMPPANPAGYYHLPASSGDQFYQ